MEYIYTTNDINYIKSLVDYNNIDSMWLSGLHQGKQNVTKQQLKKAAKDSQFLKSQLEIEHNGDIAIIFYHVAPISFSYISMFDDRLYDAFVSSTKKSIAHFQKNVFRDTLDQNLEDPNIACFFEKQDEVKCPILRSTTIIFNYYKTPKGISTLAWNSYILDIKATSHYYFKSLRKEFEQLGYKTRGNIDGSFEEKKVNISSIEDSYRRMNGEYEECSDGTVYVVD